MPSNDAQNASPETQFALLRKDISTLTKVVESLVSRMDANEERDRAKIDKIDRRVTVLETKQEDIDTVKKAVIGTAVSLIVVIIAGIAVLIQIVQAIP